MSYVYKPRASQADSLGLMSRDMKAAGYDVGVSRLYEAIADRAVAEYERLGTKLFAEQIRPYLDESEIPH